MDTNVRILKIVVKCRFHRSTRLTFKYVIPLVMTTKQKTPQQGNRTNSQYSKYPNFILRHCGKPKLPFVAPIYLKIKHEHATNFVVFWRTMATSGVEQQRWPLVQVSIEHHCSQLLFSNFAAIYVDSAAINCNNRNERNPFRNAK